MVKYIPRGLKSVEILQNKLIIQFTRHSNLFIISLEDIEEIWLAEHRITFTSNKNTDRLNFAFDSNSDAAKAKDYITEFLFEYLRPEML